MKQIRKKIFIRADANEKIGYGHVIRCIALIDMIKDDYDCYFLIRNPSLKLTKQISEVCTEYYILSDFPDFLSEAKLIVNKYLNSDSIVILDGQSFNTAYQKIIKENDCCLISIDDIHPYHFVSDAIINQIPIEIDSYNAESYTKIYSGLEYSLLRKPFLEASQKELKQLPEKPSNAFICFGGSDYFNLTSLALRSIINTISIKKVHIVIGSGFNHLKELQSLVINQNSKQISIYQDIDALEIVEIIKLCDTAIVSASSVLIECIACGVSFVTGFYVDNQKDFMNFLIQNKLMSNKINFMNISIDALSKIISEHNPANQIEKINMYRNQIKFANKNIKNMIEKTVSKPNPFLANYKKGKYYFKSFSQLNYDEMKLILEWRNHDIVRKWMFNKNIIEEKDHINFISHLHEKSDKAYWLVFKNDKPLAVVNLINFTGETCEWGIYVRPDMIGSGIGIDVQYYFLNILFTEIKIKDLIAFVNTDNSENINVQRLFDFKIENDIEYIDEIPYYKLNLNRDNWDNLEKDIMTFKLSRLLEKRNL